ncbi:hypothetical protein IQ244_10825 [Nostoc sp. LEGE 06077]|uniref:hypothetical protein n=1 Tax=Nostoc sp. LEGE 06077 TaxID=915325 RepID=UPI00187FEC73|nr:hypothetical protein [Nostoc sp. LEGE 06077]MBE9207004.1 hypothetical protein [Nostoc sp. LEGE 06077]
MSSGSSGRYQSRLFNFVHQQSRRLTERWEQSFRQVQVATKWGVEALLYPLYLLLQSTESKVKTLYTKEPQTKLKLQPNYSDRPLETPPTADTPIQRVLEVIQKLPSTEISVTSPKTPPSFQLLATWWQKLFPHSKTNNSDLSQSLTISDNSPSHLTSPQLKNVLQRYLPEVQGIATTLENRNLVLVTANNQILDILTPQQQTKLLDRIISEVASYWQYQQLTISEKQPELLPEIHRLLAKLTGEHTSNISLAATGISPELINSGRILEILDTIFAKLEEKSLFPVQQNSQEIINITRTKFNVFLYGKDELVTPAEITVTSDSLETQTLNFQTLIEAAINYFFGVAKGKKLDSDNTLSYTQEKLLPSKNYQVRSKKRQLHNQNKVIDPWLSWGDLFGNSELDTEQTANPTPKINPPLSPSTSVRLSPQTKLTVSQAKTGSGLVRRKKPNHHLTSSTKVSGKVEYVKPTETSISQNESKVREIIQHQSHNHQVEIQPDWIEIKATSIEYEQHLLEKILKLLDRIMLGLEKILGKGVKFLQKMWRGK